MNLRNWFEFDPFESKVKKSAGIVIVLKNEKVLLCHPTNSKWFGTYSFPKGGVNKGETELQAAIRELKEETSILIHESMISNSSNPLIVDYITKKGERYKKLYLYTVFIDDINQIGLESEIIPKENLQLEEIDWAGFLDKKEATVRIFHRVAHLLKTF